MNQVQTTQKPKEVSLVEVVKNDITRMEPQFKMALPPHIPAQKFVRILHTAVSTNNDLLNADRKSLFAACMKSAQDGLLPDGREAALVTFKDKSGAKIVNYMPMVNGILKKVRNSGELSSITAMVVHEKDRFRYWVDADGAHMEHEPVLFGERGHIIGTYALAKTKDGALYIEVMSEEEIKAVRSVSRARDSGPWAGAFADEMRKKSAIKRLSKRLPMSTDLEQTLRADDELYMPDVTPAPLEEKEAHVEQQALSAPRKKNTSKRLDKIVNASSEVTAKEQPAVADLQPEPDPNDELDIALGDSDEESTV